MKTYGYTKRVLIRELSDNSRTSVTNLSRKLRCSRNTVVSSMKSLEKELGLRYTLELNKNLLGLSQNELFMVKFGVKPTLEQLKEIFKDDYLLQVALKTEGDFDLLIKVTANSGEEYIQWLLKTMLKLVPFRPQLRPSVVAMVHTGFTPLQTATLAHVDLANSPVDGLDIRILQLLNENSRLSYKAISRKLREDVETIRYRMKRLVRSNIIHRFTIVLEKPPTDYTVAFVMNYEMSSGIIERYSEAQRYYLELDNKLPIINSFQYLALTSGSSILFGIGCFENEEVGLKGSISAHKNIYKEDNPTIRYGKVTGVIKGRLGIRNIDIGKEFKPINWSLLGPRP